jgi:serine/threonine-protein kinase
MGEVYRARDSKLNRDVAIKVLLPSVASDPDRLARFSREAQVLASLNHPNIAAIYGLEEVPADVVAGFPALSGVEGRRITALVMELVEGEDLSQRIARGPIPLGEALPIARQIAEALEAAHDHGIIHRDLKPANVKVRPDGTVKVLDFGLAKSTGPGTRDPGSAEHPANSPTLSIHATEAGLILGTAAYMSPEQARGKSVDKRTDLWALGCVLFEMLTRKRAFPGDDATDTIVAVVSKEPDWSALPADVPPGIRRLLRRSLEKDAKRRLDSAAGARLEIDEALTSAPDGMAVEAEMRSANWTRWTPWAIAVVAVAGAVLWSITPRGIAPARDVTRTLIGVAPADVLGATSDIVGEGYPARTTFALAPDGRSVVFSALQGSRLQLYVRALDQLAATPLAGTDEGHSPFFSPDGQWVAFQSRGSLRKIPVSGGAPPTVIGEAAAPLFGASWGADGTVVYAAESGGLWRVPSGGGSPQRLTTLDPAKREYSHRLPHFLPDGRGLIFTVTDSFLPNWDQPRLSLLTLSTGARRDLGPGADARYVSSGHLIFMQSGTLAAVPFDPAEGETSGQAVAMLSGVMQAANMNNQTSDTGAGQFSASVSGSLLYLPGGIFPGTHRALVTVDRHGKERALSAPLRPYLAPLLSPDGARLTVWTQGLDRNVWTYDLSRSTLTRLTSEGRNHRGVWTPNGRRVVYASTTNGDLFWVAADGSGVPERLNTSPGGKAASSWSPDGKTLLYLEGREAGASYDVMALSIEGERTSKPIIQSRFALGYPEFSPDGHWLAFVSRESGRDEVYVQPYPGPGPRRQISTDGGHSPAWSRNGRELFYNKPLTSGIGIQMMSVPISIRSSVEAGTPTLLFEGMYSVQALTRGYDVSADGQRFYLARLDERPPIRPNQMVLVQNWIEELKRRVPAK